MIAAVTILAIIEGVAIIGLIVALIFKQRAEENLWFFIKEVARDNRDMLGAILRLPPEPKVDLREYPPEPPKLPDPPSIIPPPMTPDEILSQHSIKPHIVI